MGPRELERLRDLIQPIESPRCQERALEFNEALANFRELVGAVIVAQENGKAVGPDLEVLLRMYGDLSVERQELERECGLG